MTVSRKWLWVLILMVASCAGNTRPAERPSGRFLGIWTVSEISYEEAARAERAVYLNGDFTFEAGKFVNRRFTAENKGRWKVSHDGKQFTVIAKDGASKTAQLIFEGSGRFLLLGEHDDRMYFLLQQK